MIKGVSSMAVAESKTRLQFIDNGGQSGLRGKTSCKLTQTFRACRYNWERLQETEAQCGCNHSGACDSKDHKEWAPPEHRLEWGQDSNKNSSLQESSSTRNDKHHLIPEENAFISFFGSSLCCLISVSNQTGCRIIWQTNFEVYKSFQIGLIEVKRPTRNVGDTIPQAGRYWSE